MRTISTLAVMVALSGCATSSGMSLSFQHTIPRNASAVRLRSDLPPRDLFIEATTLLTEQGYSFVHMDSGAMTFDTDGMPIGHSHTPLRIAIHIAGENPGSVLQATGQTLLGPGAWAPAANSSDPKAKRGFEEMTMLLGRLPNREIAYFGN